MADLSFVEALATAASTDQVLRLESSTGHADRFTGVDHLTATLTAAALRGNKLATTGRALSGAKNADTLTLTVADQDRPFLDQTFALPAQQARGAWFLPEQASLKAGTVNLPAYLRRHPWHAITLAHDDVTRVQLASTPDAVVTWSLLIPLFDTLLAPIRQRAAATTAPPSEQTELWNGIVDSYSRLGLHAHPAMSVFVYRGGWSSLDRAGQAQARARLLDMLAAHDPLAVAARFRAGRIQALSAATLKKARRNTPLARQVLTKTLQPVLSAYFAGDWLAFLNYLGLPPNPNEEIITALPQPKFYVEGSIKAAAVAAEHGLHVDEVHAMLAAFAGQSTSVSPVEQRVDLLQHWWEQFDTLHARQKPGMPTLWGLVEEGPTIGIGQERVVPLYRQLLPSDLVRQVDQLWDGVTLPRWPETIVSEPYPHRLMAETLGSTLRFWHGVALTAWYVCEGPYSRTPLSGLRSYHQRDLEAQAEAGTPIHPSLFEDLDQAEHHLGPPQDLESHAYELTLPDGRIGIRFSGGGQRRDGFEILRDIITRHRQGWTRRYLADYLRHRWTSELTATARSLHRHIAAKGKPPTFRQFAKFAATAANHWFNGDLAGLYTAIGEKAPATPRRVDLLPTTAHDFVHAVYTALGGEYYSDDLRITDFPTADRFRQMAKLASASTYYLQVAEALGRTPEPSEFGANRYEWGWATDLDHGWPQYQRAIQQARSTIVDHHRRS